MYTPADQLGSVTILLGRVWGDHPSQTAQLGIVDRFGPVVRRVARRHVGKLVIVDEYDVEISVLNAFFDGMKRCRFPDCRDRVQLQKLLRRMTRNNAINKYKWEIRRRFDRLGDDDVEDPRGAGALTYRQAKQLLEELLPNDPWVRVTALLRLKGRSDEDIAKITGVTLRQVQRRFKHLRAVLRGQEQPRARRVISRASAERLRALSTDKTRESTVAG